MAKILIHYISDEAEVYTKKISRVIGRARGEWAGLDCDRRGFVFSVEDARRWSSFTLKTVYYYRQIAFELGLYFDKIITLLSRGVDFFVITRLFKTFKISNIIQLRRLLAQKSGGSRLAVVFGRVVYKRLVLAGEFC